MSDSELPTFVEGGPVPHRHLCRCGLTTFVQPHPDGQAGFRAVCPTHGEVYGFWQGNPVDLGLERSTENSRAVFMSIENERCKGDT